MLGKTNWCSHCAARLPITAFGQQRRWRRRPSSSDTNGLWQADCTEKVGVIRTALEHPWQPTVHRICRQCSRNLKQDGQMNVYSVRIIVSARISVVLYRRRRTAPSASCCPWRRFKKQGASSDDIRPTFCTISTFCRSFVCCPRLHHFTLCGSRLRLSKTWTISRGYVSTNHLTS